MFFRNQIYLHCDPRYHHPKGRRRSGGCGWWRWLSGQGPIEGDSLPVPGRIPTLLVLADDDDEGALALPAPTLDADLGGRLRDCDGAVATRLPFATESDTAGRLVASSALLRCDSKVAVSCGSDSVWAIFEPFKRLTVSGLAVSLSSPLVFAGLAESLWAWIR